MSKKHINIAATKEKGGLITDGETIEATTGNAVPPGSNAEEVKDNIDAKLSENEYVIPADIVRYYGVAFFEKLRKKAKDGLAEMDAEGRIGGEPIEEDGEDEELPFDLEELEVEDDAIEEQMQGAGFAEGGVVGSNPASNPEQYSTGYSVFGSPVDVTKLGYTTKTYVNAAGKQIIVQFDTAGNPTTKIPEGYYELGTTPPKPPAETKPMERPEGAGQRDNSGTQAGEEGGSGGSGFRSQDFAGMSREDAVSAATDRLAGAETAGQLGAGLGAAIGLAFGSPGKGAALGKTAGVGTRVADALGVANIREGMGDTEGAKQIRDAVEATTGTGGLLGLVAKGNWGKNVGLKSKSTGTTTTSSKSTGVAKGLGGSSKGSTGGSGGYERTGGTESRR